MTMQKQISLAVLFFLLPASVSAATLSLRATPVRVGVGDTVLVSLLLDSAIPTNAFSGALQYPAAMLEPVAISDGGSIISLWIAHPAVPAPGVPVTFAGVTPGGFSGNNGSLFSVLFRAKAAGTAKVSLGDVEVLRNDGAGGNEPVSVRSLTLSIDAKSSGGYVEPADRTPPEPFTAYLGTDSQLFNGKDYLMFMAVDKGSGVDHYAVAESRLPSFLFSLFPPSWHTTTSSPYVLADQKLTSTIYVKAVDRAGNERLSVFPPQHLFTAYEKWALLVILMGVAFLWQRVQGRRF